MNAERSYHRRSLVEPQNDLWNANRLATEKPINSKPPIVVRIRHSHFIEAKVCRVVGFGRIAIDIVETTRRPLDIHMAIE